MNTAPQPVDALVIGAGPVGLYQVFQLGLQELRCTVIDVLPEAGGQCAALYPHKPIYDIPALPVCSGAELVERLLRQIEPLRPEFRFGDEAVELAPLPDGRWRLRSAGGGDWAARIVVIAAGVGAFVPRKLKVAGHDALFGHGLSYQAPTAEDLAGPDPLWICGADDRALSWARRAAEAGQAVRLLHRREVFDAEPEALDWLAAARAAGRVELVLGLPETLHAGADGRLAALELLAPDGISQRHTLSRLHVSLGLSPRLGALAQWPLALERKLVRVDPATMASSQPGVYAVGDICHYAGKLKLITSGFHEATLAAHAAARWLRPEAPHPLEYTTSSARLQRLLGVAGTP